MIKISIATEATHLVEILSKAPAEIQDLIGQEFKDWGLRTQNLARMRAPYETGNLKQSIMSTPSDDGVSVFADTSTTANVDYAKYVEPPPLGVPMTRPMTRTQFLYNSAMEELDNLVDRLSKKIGEYLEG